MKLNLYDYYGLQPIYVPCCSYFNMKTVKVCTLEKNFEFGSNCNFLSNYYSHMTIFDPNFLVCTIFCRLPNCYYTLFHNSIAPLAFCWKS
jgi:hypothetical protein